MADKSLARELSLYLHIARHIPPALQVRTAGQMASFIICLIRRNEKHSADVKWLDFAFSIERPRGNRTIFC